MEASRRSNMTCLQLYMKEIEASPGDSAASSIMYRHLSNLGGISSLSCEFQVFYLLLFFLPFLNSFGEIFFPHKKTTESCFQDAVKRLCAWRDLMVSISPLKFIRINKYLIMIMLQKLII